MSAEVYAQTSDQFLSCRVLDQVRQVPPQLFRRARDQGRRGQRLSRLTGQSRHLLDLARVEADYTVLARFDAGVQTVAIDQICGSEGRCRYFDRDFRPLHDEARGRWLNIATARQQGKHLPPVTLVQVGDIYFVRDGHHRISVARALGQLYIEARVTVWQVAGPLPWDAPAQPSRPWLAGVRHALKQRWLQGLAGRVRRAFAPMTANRPAEG
jgi:hypothetical protein